MSDRKNQQTTGVDLPKGYANWWKYLLWEEMQETWERLSDEIKDEIRKSGNAPSWDKP